MTGISCIAWTKVPTLPQRLGNGGTVFLDVYLSKGWLPCPRERQFRLTKLARNRFTAQRDRKIIYSYKFSNICTLKKRGSGA